MCLSSIFTWSWSPSWKSLMVLGWLLSNRWADVFIFCFHLELISLMEDSDGARLTSWQQVCRCDYLLPRLVADFPHGRVMVLGWLLSNRWADVCLLFPLGADFPHGSLIVLGWLLGNRWADVFVFCFHLELISFMEESYGAKLTSWQQVSWCVCLLFPLAALQLW